MAEPDSQSVSAMFCIGYTRTLLDEMNEDILGNVEFHEVGIAGIDLMSLHFNFTFDIFFYVFSFSCLCTFLP